MNPYFDLETLPSPEGWAPLATLTDPATLRERAGATRASFGGGPVRAAASIDFLGLVARLVSPVLAALGATGTAPVLAGSSTWWRPAVPGPFRLAVVAPERASSLTDAVLVPSVVPLVDVYAATFAMSRIVLWGNVASALNGAAVQLGRGRRDYRRTTCCLLYRLPRGGRCGDCVLDR